MREWAGSEGTRDRLCLQRNAGTSKPITACLYQLLSFCREKEFLEGPEFWGPESEAIVSFCNSG